MIGRSRFLAGSALVCAALLVSAVAARTQGTPEAEFQKLADAFAQAWGKGDGKAIAALHTTDAVRLSGTGEPAVWGTAEIEKAMGGAVTGPYKGTTLTIKNNKYQRINDTTYLGEGTWEVTGGTVPAGVPTRGQYMNTMVREGGTWLIAGSAVIPAMQPK